MSKKYLPIGSVVLLRNGNKRVMICGRIQAKAGSDTIFDYSACYYPEGIIDPANMFFFNHDTIDKVFFIGFQDQEELNYRNKLESLGELEICDGKILPKNR